MSFSTFVHALARYKPYVREEIPQILTFVFIFVVFVCWCVICSLSLPPEYFVYAFISALLTVITSLLALAAHVHAIKELSYATWVFALFALASSATLIRILHGEHNTCAKLYDNEAAAAALSDRLDELGSATGSVVSASLLDAEASQQISHFGMLCMGLRYSDAWYKAHMAVLYLLCSLTILNSLTSFAVTLLNFKGAMAWLEAREHSLMHLYHNSEAALKQRIEKLGSFIHHHYHHHHSD